ncbi:HPr family phosphocarrier protein [Evansella cellulosilytica]|uniref:Phosphoryl transfer system HPr n=1 Tax=Evansella cellulosilytica (strain ATCC 21833 / DSM 2522 / FERM P-1141 / JCM 9156 / N-4) TaxID=649639 RepID=E6TVY7_EVAC2|nr:HPr family phosphocarrier protein [Evansella cellulosilytica]ADU29810.1 phosphoryl transfer system HPr [Evansella cellulosilytica DSM 2522]
MKLTVQKPIFADAASQFVNTASKYNATILLKKDHWVVDSKSLLGVLALALQPGQEVDITFEGEGSDAFAQELVDAGLFAK